MTSDRDRPMIEQVTQEVFTPLGPTDGPYLQFTVQRTSTARAWNPNYPEDARCQCGHVYYRHFDTWEQMLPCGCKYCDCYMFVPLKDVEAFPVNHPQILHKASGLMMAACYHEGKFGYAVGSECTPIANFRAIKFFPKVSEHTFEDALDYMRELASE